MSDLRELYQELILDHGRTPRNFRREEAANHHADGFNPLCGDQISLFVQVDADNRIQDVAFQGKGCAISTASASLMTQALKGKSLDDARTLFDHFHDMITGQENGDAASAHEEALGKLAVFSGVRDYPNRVKCATLAWHTLNAALDGKNEPVTTE